MTYQETAKRRPKYKIFRSVQCHKVSPNFQMYWSKSYIFVIRSLKFEQYIRDLKVPWTYCSTVEISSMKIAHSKSREVFCCRGILTSSGSLQ